MKEVPSSFKDPHPSIFAASYSSKSLLIGSSSKISSSGWGCESISSSFYKSKSLSLLRSTISGSLENFSFSNISFA